MDFKRKSAVILTIGFLCAGTGKALASDSLNVRAASVLAEAAGLSVAYDPDHDVIYAGDGSEIRILDASRADTLITISRITIPGLPYGMKYYDGHLYVAGYKKDLIVIDVQDVANPRVISVYDTPAGFGYGLDIYPPYLYLADGGRGLVVLDITNPASPVEINVISGYNLRDVAIQGNYAYASQYTYVPEEFIVFDITDPENPARTGGLDINEYLPSISVRGQYAYLPAVYSGLYIVDISDPTSPSVISHLDTVGSVYHILPLGDTLLVANGYMGFMIVDASDPADPQVESIQDLPGLTRRVAVRTGSPQVYTADYTGGLHLLDINDITSPVVVSEIPLPGLQFAAKAYGGRAYITGYSGKLRILDISDIQNPVDIAPWTLFSYDYDLETDGSYLYTASNYLRVIDVRDPTSPAEVSTLNTPGDVFAIKLSGNYLYIADGDSGLTIVDITDPYAPSIVSTTSLNAHVRGIDLYGNYAVLSSTSSGLIIVDVSNPYNPFVVSTMDLGLIWSLRVNGNIAYLAAGIRGVYSVDISDPHNPTILDSLDTSDARYVDISDTVLVVADVGSGVRIVSISDPGNMYFTGNYLTPGLVYRVALYGENILTPDYEGGFRILEPFQPTGVSEEAKDVLFWRVEKGQIVLRGEGNYTIYTANGRKVREGRLNGSGMQRILLPAGSYILKWNEKSTKFIIY